MRPAPIVTVTAVPPPPKPPHTSPRQILPFLAFGAILLVLLLALIFCAVVISNRRAAALAAPFSAESRAGDEDLRRLDAVVPSSVLRRDGRPPSSDGWSQTVCVICLEKLEEGSAVRHLPCRHLFHTPCIDRWFRSQRYTCPICIAPYFVSP